MRATQPPAVTLQPPLVAFQPPSVAFQPPWIDPSVAATAVETRRHRRSPRAQMLPEQKEAEQKWCRVTLLSSFGD